MAVPQFLASPLNERASVRVVADGEQLWNEKYQEAGSVLFNQLLQSRDVFQPDQVRLVELASIKRGQLGFLFSVDGGKHSSLAPIGNDRFERRSTLFWRRLIRDWHQKQNRSARYPRLSHCPSTTPGSGSSGCIVGCSSRKGSSRVGSSRRDTTVKRCIFLGSPFAGDPSISRRNLPRVRR